MASIQAVQATARFGLGARPDELAAAGSDPRGWALAQLRRPTDRIEAIPASPARADEMIALIQSLVGGARGQADSSADSSAGAPAGARPELAPIVPGDRTERRERQRAFLDSFIADAQARLAAAVTARDSVAQRWKWHWSNHFTVSATRHPVRPLAGPYEEEAIRPHLAGRFVAMLRAAALHPAMLVYLDQARSIGPNSIVGRRRNVGLNENLAREILELHTLGVGGGYTQEDVQALARILTGWTVALGDRGPARRLLAADATPGTTVFLDALHEPGPKTLLGHHIPEGGSDETDAAFRILAEHASTARHVATRLARHYVADRPPASAIAGIERAFRDSGGELAAVAHAVVTAPEGWAEPLSKVRTPTELLVAAHRAAGRSDAPALPDLRELDHLPWSAPSPAGWSDTASDWMSPEAAVARAEWALRFGRRLGRTADVPTLLAGTLAGAASRQTAFTVANAPSQEEGVALLVASPEFQRR